MMTPYSSGTPSSSFRPIAVPITSARSVATMASSARTQRPKETGARKGIAAGLREVAVGRDREPRAERLQDDRHQARDERGEEQRVAEARAAGERGRPVAGVHVAGGDEVARPEEDQRPPPDRSAGADGDRMMHFGKRRRAALGAPARERPRARRA